MAVAGANTSIKKQAGTHVCLDSVQETSTAISFHVRPLQGLAPQANINTTTQPQANSSLTSSHWFNACTITLPHSCSENICRHKGQCIAITYVFISTLWNRATTYPSINTVIGNNCQIMTWVCSGMGACMVCTHRALTPVSHCSTSHPRAHHSAHSTIHTKGTPNSHNNRTRMTSRLPSLTQ